MAHECIAVTGAQRVVLYERPKGQERNVCINSLSVFFLPCGCRDAHCNSMPCRVYMHCASFQLLNVF